MNKKENASSEETDESKCEKPVNKIPSGNISKKQLAMMFHSTLTYSGAIKAFNREIEANPEMQAELIKNHWDPKLRIFTIVQRDIIFKYLGNPYND